MTFDEAESALYHLREYTEQRKMEKTEKYHNESECSMWNNSDDQNMDQQNIIDQFNDDLISYDEAREVAIRMKQKTNI